MTTGNSNTRISAGRLICVLLAITLLCSLAACNGKGNVSALGGDPLAIASFAELVVTQISVEAGTPMESIALPPTLGGFAEVEPTMAREATDSANAEGETQTMTQLEKIEVPVTWVCETYDSETAGTYIFVSQLMEDYTFEGEMPQIAVLVYSAEVIATPDPEMSTEETPVPEPTQEGTISPEPTVTPELVVTLDDAVTVSPEPTAGISPEAYQITAFINEPIAFEVARGTAIENLPLPVTLPALNALGEQIEVPVTWVNITEATEFFEYNPNDYVSGSVYGYGPWIFTAQLGAVEAAAAAEASDAAAEADAVLPAATYAYVYTGEPVTASVRLPDCMTVDNIGGYSSDVFLFRFVIFQGDSVGLPTEIGAMMTDGGYKSIPVSWSGNYDRDTIGSYAITMHIGGGYSGGGRTTGEVVVMREYH